jgi:rhodanese-related sulfurtransferase
MHRDGAWGAGSRAKAETGGFLFACKTNEGEGRSVQHQRRSRQRPFNDARSKISVADAVLRFIPGSVARRLCPARQTNEAGAMSNDNKIAGTYQVSPAAGYTGDVAPATAWKILSERKDAVLIDVRTRAEWNYVGLPDLDSIAKKPALLEWQVFPSMQPNPEFVAALSGAIANKDAALLFLCRSGARSAAAAKAMTAAGYSTCLNVADGFEGPLDAQAKRGSAGGWKAAGLPWRQT